MLLSTILTSSLLAFPSPLGGSASPCAGPAQRFGGQIYPLDSFDGAHQRLAQSVEALRQSLAQGQISIEMRDQVRLELERLRHFADQIALDPSVDALFTEAMLVVAASVQTCDPDLAQAWVDRALARGRVVDVTPSPQPDLQGLPDDFTLLYEQRAVESSTAELATIRLRCAIDCRVFVDGHQVPVALGKVTEHPVHPGLHDVWMFQAPQPGDSSASSPTRVSVTEIELGSGDQNCVDFPNPSYVTLLPSREEWWSAWSFTRRIDWAIESKKASVDIETSMFETLVEESSMHTRVLAQDAELRELRIRLALHLADLWQQAGEADAANAVLDRTLLWADLLDSRSMLAAAVGKFPGLTELFEGRVLAMAGKPRGSVEVDCRRCLPVIDGVVVDADTLELPVGVYRVEVYPTSAKGEFDVFDNATVRANELTTLRKDSPPKAPPAPEEADIEDVYPRNPQVRRWVWGTAGAAVLLGGAVWAMGLTAGLLPGIKTPDGRLELVPAINFGLAATGVFVVHAEVAAYLFCRMPPFRRPGSAMLATGVGFITFGALSVVASGAGWASNVVSANDTDKTVGIGAAALSGALFITGITLSIVGAKRRKTAIETGALRPERAPRAQRPGMVSTIVGGGLLSASLGIGGLGFVALTRVLADGGYSDADRDAAASAAVGLGIGGIMAVSGATLLVVGATRKRAKGARSMLAPSFVRGSVGVQLVGRF